MKSKIAFISFLIFYISTSIIYSGEWVAFKSLTKSTGFELKGILTKPTGQGPFPAVVMLHGAGGIESEGKSLDIWAQRIADWGYISLLVDSFTPRGESNITDNVSAISARTRAQDAYDAKSYLNGLPFVKKNQIAIMGWSHGGWSLLRAGDNLMHMEDRGEPFQLGVAFYPYCDISLKNLNTPILILAGELDDWCPVEMCQSGMPSEKGKHEVILKIYTEATHCFDYVGIDKTINGHRLLYNPSATNDAIKQVKKYLGKYLQ